MRLISFISRLFPWRKKEERKAEPRTGRYRAEWEEELKRKEEKLEEKARELSREREELEKEKEETEELRSSLSGKLEKMAGLTKKEAQETLLSQLEKELTAEKAKKIKEAEEKVKQEAARRARKILVSAMEQAATDYVSEATVSQVRLPHEDIKGKVIGREGRNIKALERETGVDVEVDETSEVKLSSFDSERRAVAKEALERLIKEGRINPPQIEKAVGEARKNFGKKLREKGEELALKAGVHDLPPKILEYLGKLHYRTSYGQNQAQHTLEVVNLAVFLAEEVGARVDLIRKAALLHDIGKVVGGREGSHVEKGKRLLRKFRFDPELIHTAMAHHRDEPFQNLEAALVYIADAISSARPGARKEDYETYTQRIEKLEKVAQDFSGVKDAFAFAAGREVEVLVRPEEISDDQAVVLARKIARRIEKEATYPGTVEVNVIREVRASETAR